MSNSVDYLTELKNYGARVDFVSYHPYDHIFGYWNSTGHTSLPDNANVWTESNKAYLRDQISGIFDAQNAKAVAIRNIFPDVELLSTEWNPSSWEASWYLDWREKSMAQALAVMETIFSFSRIGVSQAHYYTLPTGPNTTDTTHPTYKTFQFLKDHLGNTLLQSYDNGSPATTYNRGYVIQDNSSGTVSLWGLNWGDSSATIDFSLTVSGLYNYSMTGCYDLTAPSLLHGKVNGGLTNDFAPPLTQTLPINYTPTSSFWNNGLINYSMNISKASWIACFITRTPKGPIWTVSLPIIIKSSNNQMLSGASYLNSNPYPAPGSVNEASVNKSAEMENASSSESTPNPYPYP